MIDRSFEGRVAAITGAGKGLGRAYALWLAERGCAVVVSNRVHPGVASSARALVDRIVAAGGRAVAHEGAVEDPDASRTLVETAIEAFGGLDILVCNAGVMPRGGFADIEPAEIARTVEINVLGTLYPARAAWRHMLRTGYGRIVLSGSSVGVYGHGGVSVYGATRAAPIGLARSLTLERPAGSDIGVNVVLPFAITDMAASTGLAADDPALDPMRPDRVAPIVGWLCGESCRRSGEIFHAAAMTAARVGLVESPPVLLREGVDLGAEAFALDPLVEPARSEGTVARMTAPARAAAPEGVP